MHKAQLRTESVLFVFPALSFVKSLHRFPSYWTVPHLADNRKKRPPVVGGIRQNVNRQTPLLDRRIFAGIPMIVVIPA